MKTLKLIAAGIMLMMGLRASAQQIVTGSVTLVDTNLQAITNASGIMVVFQVQGSPGVSDTVYTDTSGNYIDTLTQGIYTPFLYKTDFAAIELSNIVISAGPVVIPNAKMNQELPKGIIPNPLRGILQPNTLYYGRFLTINAGDTLIVPEGTWLLYFDLEIYGNLIVQGSPAHPACLFEGDSINGGFAIAQSGPFSGVNLDSGGTFIANYANLPAFQCSTTNANLRLSNVNDFAFNSPLIGYRLGQAFRAKYTMLNSTANISECYLHGQFSAQAFSQVNFFCNALNSPIVVGSGCILDFEDNIDSFNVGIGNSASSAVIKNNYFAGNYNAITISNPVPAAPVNIEITNNSFDDHIGTPNRVQLQSGNCNLKLVNNLGLSFFINVPDTFTNVNITESKYNIIYPVSSYGGTYQQYYPTFSTLPTGVTRFIDSLNAHVDTFDANNNRYISNCFPVFDTFPNYHTGADTLFLHTGDPALTNVNGSRSNIGAFRDTVGCINVHIPIPRADTTGTVVIVVSNDSVWPGDANYDGICNNLEVLPIGVKYGATGPVRANASLVWTPQYCAQWNDSLASHRNIKHVDCNGDGTIDYSDVNAIYQNYSLVHALVPKAGSFGNGLWLQFPSDSVFTGDTVAVKVMLGTHAQPVNNIYGIAFSLTYDSAFIKPGSARMTFQPCWMGTDSLNMISFFKEIIQSSRYDMALARTDHFNISGNGQIGSLIIVINDDIQAKDSVTLTTKMLFSSIYAIDSVEHPKTLGGDDGTFNVELGERSPTGIKGITDEKLLTVYPNPANDKLIISLQGITKAQVSLSSPDGRKVMSMEMTNEKQEMDISTLPPGFYILKFEHNGNTVCRKIMIAR